MLAPAMNETNESRGADASGSDHASPAAADVAEGGSATPQLATTGNGEALGSWREWAFAAGLLLVAVIIGGVSAEFSAKSHEQSPMGAAAGFPLDDAWIHQVYARSLWRSHRFEYNDGESEIGLTSPLFAALLAPLHRSEGS